MSTLSSPFTFAAARQGGTGPLRKSQLRDCFFEERSLIPPGRFHEVSFEELEKDPVGQIERIYETLSLPGLSDMRPALERYLESQKQYEKNTFPALDEALRSRVFEKWERCFEEWGYER